MSRLKKTFSKEQQEWILGNIHSCRTLNEIKNKFTKKFNEFCRFERLKEFCEENGIYMVNKVHLYSNKELEWLRGNRDNYISLAEMAKDFNNKFGTNTNRLKLSAIFRDHNIKRSDFKRNVYTNEFYEWLFNNYNNYTNKEISTIIKEKFNVDLNADGIQALLKRKGYSKENDGKFKEHELGHEILRKGIPYIKVKKYTCKNIDIYRRKANVIYEQYHNVELKKDDIVLNLDGDPFNFDKDNLILLSKYEFQVYHIKSQHNEVNNIYIKKLLLNIVKLENIIKNEGKEYYKNSIEVKQDE